MENCPRRKQCPRLVNEELNFSSYQVASPNSQHTVLNIPARVGECLVLATGTIPALTVICSPAHLQVAMQEKRRSQSTGSKKSGPYSFAVHSLSSLLPNRSYLWRFIRDLYLCTQSSLSSSSPVRAREYRVNKACFSASHASPSPFIQAVISSLVALIVPVCPCLPMSARVTRIGGSGQRKARCLSAENNSARGSSAFEGFKTTLLSVRSIRLILSKSENIHVCTTIPVMDNLDVMDRPCCNTNRNRSGTNGILELEEAWIDKPASASFKLPFESYFNEMATLSILRVKGLTHLSKVFASRGRKYRYWNMGRRSFENQTVLTEGSSWRYLLTTPKSRSLPRAASAEGVVQLRIRTCGAQ